MRKLNVGIAVAPNQKQLENKPLLYLLKVICPLSKNVFVITGKNNVAFQDNLKNLRIYEVKRNNKNNILLKIINHIDMELSVSYKLIRLSKNVDLWFFYTGGLLPIPMMFAKLQNKKSVLITASAPAAYCKKPKSIFYFLTILTSKISYLLANEVIVYSESLIKKWKIEKYRYKITVACEHFVDFDKFQMKKKLSERNNVVGYIGRLSEEKGTFNFVKAIPLILKRGRDDLDFLIVGDGNLRDEIAQYLNVAKLDNNIKLTGWISHDELPDYLNELKLLVIPSYTETGPLIALEAMSCGTPVLATSVGHIPDMIKDEDTGFIMENNLPDCIAENVMRALEHPDLEEIVERAMMLVKLKFTYDAAMKQYTSILHWSSVKDLFNK